MVRRIIIFLGVFILSIRSFAAGFPSSNAIASVEISSDNAESYTISFQTENLFPQQVQIENQSSDVLLLPGEGMLLEQGRPVLPSINRFVIVPSDRALEFSYHVENSFEVSGENQPVLFNEEYAGIIMGQKFGGQDYYPPIAAEMSEPFIIRGVRMVKITTYPVQYNSSTNKYLINEGIETQIDYVNGEPINSVNNPSRRHRSENFKKYIEALVINPDANHRDEFEETTMNNGHYVIATHEDCLPFAAPFVEWRRKAGYKVDILSFSPNDARAPNTVKRAIQNLYDDYIENGEDPFDMVHLIGDRNRYTYAGQAQWILEAENGHADYRYALLEGNDDHPDVGVARWPNGSRQMMELVVGKTMAYEAEPYMEDPSWFRRGAVYTQHWGNNAQSAWHQSIIVGPRWAEEVMKQHGVDEVWAYEDMDWDQYALRLGADLVDRYDEGTNLMFGRAELYVFTPRPPNGQINFGSLEDNVVFPIEINMSGHSEWSREIMYRTGNGNNLKGPVATSFGWNGPATTAMTVMMMEMVNGLMQRDLPYGMAYSMACTAMELSISNYQWRNQSVYANTRLETDAFSDPGLQPWLGIPQIVTASMPEQVVQDVRLIAVNVQDPENNEPVSGATVTLYAPGDIPDFDSDNYADYDDMIMLTMTADQNGMANFILDDDIHLDGDIVYITVTGRDIVPHFGEIEIVRDLVAVELVEFSLEESEGNEDGDINPGETFTLSLTAGNISDEDNFQEVSAAVTSNSPWIEIENGETTFGNIAAGESAEAESQVTINISQLCPDGIAQPSQKPEIHIEFSSGDDSWSSAIVLDPFSPAFVVHQVVGGIQIPTGQLDLNIEIKNVGRFDSDPIDASLMTMGLGVTVVAGSADYPAMEVNESARIDGNLFNVSGNTIVVPGSTNPMKMILRNRTGFVDTAYFHLQVGETGENVPYGPDGFGYVCFDNTDEDWDISPVYEWIEIDPNNENRDFNGTACDFDGRSEQDVGEAQVADLGFTTRFYGYDYDQITISSNGFITPGAQDRISNFQNYPLDRGIGGGAGMIAPFWDWLDINDNSGVFFYHDEEDAKFIIEWSKLRHNTVGRDDLTFQVIIYDADVWVTESGNPNIIFQYKDITNIRGRAEPGTPGEKNVFFASVGISSPDGDTGLSYSFADDYPVSCPPLENRMALLFATSTEFLSGYIYGRVTDVETGDPIENVTVITGHGMAALTDSTGFWEINEALAEVPFAITASLQGYNDSTYVEMFIEENDTLEINFALLHPDFVPSTLYMQTRLDPGASRDLSFDVRNDGNGPLTWMVTPRLPGNADAEPWEFREDFHFGEQLEDDKLYGVLFLNDQFYISGSNRGQNEEGDIVSNNTIYILDNEGALIDTIAQPGENRYGMKDLAYDGELLWGAVGNDIYGITLEGEVVTTFDAPYHPSSAITWDPEREILWIAGTTNDPLGYDREGNFVEGMEIDRDGAYIYGLAYFTDDPDGAPLYFFTKERETNRQMVLKYNIETEEKTFVAYFDPEEGGSPQGVCITNSYDVYSWVFMSVSNSSRNDGNDRVDIHQIEGRSDWFQLDLVTGEDRQEAESGVLQTGETGEFILHFDALDLPTVEFATELHFFHNATGGHTLINGVMNVIGPMPADSFALVSPPDSSFFEDLEVEFTWNPTIDPNEDEPIEYHLWLESGDESRSFEIVDNSLSLKLDTTIVLLEEDMDFTWWVLALSGEDTVESGSRFGFKLVYNSAGDMDGLMPVEYGLRSIYPNPFNSVTSITFGADKSEHIRLIAYDISGREVVRLFDGVPRRGYHRLAWRADTVPTGVYLLRLESPGRTRVAKVALVK